MKNNIEKASMKTILNPITMITGLILLFGLMAAGLAILLLGRDPAPAVGATPVVTKIAAPTLTPKILTPTLSSSPSPTSRFFVQEGEIGIGAYVQVSGTQGAGLRMRAEPGLSGSVNFSAIDSEAFLVIDGPVEADGYVWWHLEAPYDKNRNGWSAGDFLTPIEEDDQG